MASAPSAPSQSPHTPCWGLPDSSPTPEMSPGPRSPCFPGNLCTPIPPGHDCCFPCHVLAWPPEPLSALLLDRAISSTPQPWAKCPWDILLSLHPSSPQRSLSSVYVVHVLKENTAHRGFLSLAAGKDLMKITLRGRYMAVCWSSQDLQSSRTFGGMEVGGHPQIRWPTSHLSHPSSNDLCNPKPGITIFFPILLRD